MRWIVLAILLLVLTSDSIAQSPDPLCVLDPTKMPESWRPPPELRKKMNPAPWSDSEAKDALYAIETGLDEMIGYYKQYPSAVQNLWDDSIESLIQVTYASANKPEFDAKARDAARTNLTALVAPYLDLDPEDALCEEFDELLPIAIFAHKLNSANDTLKDVITKRANASFRACDSLEDAITIDFQKILENEQEPPEDIEDLFDLYLWCLWLIEAELYPDIELPDETRNFGRAFWKYFKTYRLAGAREFENGAQDETFTKIADLANHIAHIPTGNHRFPLYVEDSPPLYRFHRKNFYLVMQADGLDLFSSFVDTLRQYGCTAKNDVQVRDGSRYLLEIFHGNKDRWMNYRNNNQSDEDLSDYDLIHHPWTAILGLRDRKPEKPKLGTYGGIVRRWLPIPHEKN